MNHTLHRGVPCSVNLRSRTRSGTTIGTISWLYCELVWFCWLGPAVIEVPRMPAKRVRVRRAIQALQSALEVHTDLFRKVMRDI